MNLRKSIIEALDTIKYSDMQGNWGKPRKKLKLQTIPEVSNKLKQSYLDFKTGYENFEKRFINKLVKDIGITPDEASDIVSQYQWDLFKEGEDEYDLEIDVMGRGYSVFDEIESLKNAFGGFKYFKENFTEHFREWQDKVGEQQDSEGNFIVDIPQYDEDSEDFYNLFLSGISPEDAFVQLLKTYNLEDYL